MELEFFFVSGVFLFVLFLFCLFLFFLFVCVKIGVSINEDNLEYENGYLRSDGTFVT